MLSLDGVGAFEDFTGRLATDYVRGGRGGEDVGWVGLAVGELGEGGLGRGGRGGRRVRDNELLNEQWEYRAQMPTATQQQKSEEDAAGQSRVTD